MEYYIVINLVDDEANMAIGSSTKVAKDRLRIRFWFRKMVIKDSNVGYPWIFVNSGYSKCDSWYLGAKKLISWPFTKLFCWVYLWSSLVN